MRNASPPAGRAEATSKLAATSPATRSSTNHTRTASWRRTPTAGGRAGTAPGIGATDAFASPTVPSGVCPRTPQLASIPRLDLPASVEARGPSAGGRYSTGRHGFIDLFWPGRLLAEHKSAGRSLDEALAQALDYLPGMDEEGVPSVVVACDFGEFLPCDMCTSQ